MGRTLIYGALGLAIGFALERTLEGDFVALLIVITGVGAMIYDEYEVYREKKLTKNSDEGIFREMEEEFKGFIDKK